MDISAVCISHEKLLGHEANAEAGSMYSLYTTGAEAAALLRLQ
jgi:hypothetical protein